MAASLCGGKATTNDTEASSETEITKQIARNVAGISRAGVPVRGLVVLVCDAGDRPDTISIANAGYSTHTFSVADFRSITNPAN